MKSAEDRHYLLRAMRMPIKWPYVICLFIVFGALFFLFYPRIENFFVFFPQTSFDFTPRELGLKAREVHFTAEDGTRLHGWFFAQPGPAPVLLFCHGNAGNISHRLHNIRLLMDRNLQVFIFDYRGYGRSSGRPSERGIYMDGIAAFDWLTREAGIPPDRIVLFGRSLGAAVALEAALRRPCRSLIIESGFTSTKDMARGMFPFTLISPLLPAHYNNLGKVARVDKPKLIIHGEGDDLVPFAMGERLFKAAKDPKFFYPIRGAGHNDTYEVGGVKYFEVLSAFVKNSEI